MRRKDPKGNPVQSADDAQWKMQTSWREEHGSSDTGRARKIPERALETWVLFQSVLRWICEAGSPSMPGSEESSSRGAEGYEVSGPYGGRGFDSVLCKLNLR